MSGGDFWYIHASFSFSMLPLAFKNLTLSRHVRIVGKALPYFITTGNIVEEKRENPGVIATLRIL